MELLQAVAATVLLSCCLFALSGVEGQTILRSQSSGVVNVEDVYVAVGSNLTNVFCYTDDGTVGFGITDSTSGQFQGVPIFNASDPPPPRVFFQKRLAAAPGFLFGYELNAHDYVGPQHIVGCSNDIVQARIVVGSRIGSIAHATSDNSIQGLFPGNYTFNESDTIPPIVCRAASGEPMDGSIHLNGTLFNGSSAVTMNPATARQIIYYVPSMGGSSGVYTCTGFNQFNTPADTVRRVFRITIQFRPDFAGTVNRHTVHMGDQLVLSCRVSAFPELTDLYVLYPNGTRTDSLVTDLSAGTSRDVRKVTFLNAAATGAHAGNYSCNGDNLVGASSQQIEVIVLVPPSAPRNLTVVSNSSNTIELNFAQPALDGGSPVVDYIVNCTRDENVPHFMSATTTGLSVNITGVYSGENYTCSVRARSVVGFGPAASVTVMLLEGVPCKPSVTQNNTALGLHLNIFVPCDGGDNLVCTISRVQAGSTPFTVPRCEAGRPITYTDSSIQDGTYVYILTVTNAMGSVDVETGMLSAITPAPTASSSTALTTGNNAGTPPTSAPSSGGISGGAIAGIIVGGLLLLAFVIVIVIVVWKKTKDTSGEVNVSYSSKKGRKEELHYANVDHTHKDGGKSGTSASTKSVQATNYAPLDFDKSGKKADDNPMALPTTQSPSATTTTTAPTEPPTKAASGLSGGAIAGIIIGVLLVFIIIIVVVIVVLRMGGKGEGKASGRGGGGAGAGAKADGKKQPINYTNIETMPKGGQAPPPAPEPMTEKPTVYDTVDLKLSGKRHEESVATSSTIV